MIQIIDSALYDEIILRETKLFESIREGNNSKSAYRITIQDKRKRRLVVLSLTSFLVVIILGIVLGCMLFRREVEGYNTICYTTDTGECYHSAGCGYLKSRHKTNVYYARIHGYRACSRCSVGRLDVSEKNGIEYGLLTAIVAVIIPLSLYIVISKKRCKEEISINDKRIDDIKNKNEQFFSEYCSSVIKQYGLLRIINAPECIQLKNGKLYSKDENLYRYVAWNRKIYHSDKNCSGGYYRETIVYDLSDDYYPCCKCAIFYNRGIPEWYHKYKRLKSTIIRYKIKV